MIDFVQREIWLPILVNSDEEVKALSGSPGTMYKGAEVVFRLALFQKPPQSLADPGEFRNHSNLFSFIMKIRSGGYAGSNPLLLDSSAGTAIVSIDPTATEEQFIRQERAPINIYCPSSITAIAEANQYASFFGATSDKPAQPDGFGRGRINVIDIGIGAADSVAPSGPTAVTTDLFNAAMANVVKFGRNPNGKYPIFANNDGSFGFPVRCGDNGEIIMDPIQNP